MAKDSKPESAPQAAPVDQALTVDEFCQRLSKSDKRVELIAGFHASEKAASRFKDVESQFLARFGEFVNKPV